MSCKGDFYALNPIYIYLSKFEFQQNSSKILVARNGCYVGQHYQEYPVKSRVLLRFYTIITSREKKGEVSFQADAQTKQLCSFKHMILVKLYLVETKIRTLIQKSQKQITYGDDV